MNPTPPTPLSGGNPSVMDVAGALQFWKDPEVYRKFLRKFALEYPLCVAEMRAVDGAAARARAHKLRGAAASLMLGELTQAAATLEQRLAAGSDTEAAYAGLQQALDLALAQIRDWAGASPDPTAG